MCDIVTIFLFMNYIQSLPQNKININKIKVQISKMIHFIFFNQMHLLQQSIPSINTTFSNMSIVPLKNKIFFLNISHFKISVFYLGVCIKAISFCYLVSIFSSNYYFFSPYTVEAGSSFQCYFLWESFPKHRCLLNHFLLVNLLPNQSIKPFVGMMPVVLDKTVQC